MENTALGDMTWFPAADDYLMICSPSGRILFVTSSLRFQLEEDLVGRSLNDILYVYLLLRSSPWPMRARAIPFTQSSRAKPSGAV